MRGKWKRGLAVVCAIAVVVAAGVFSSDHFLKATDGEENIVETPESVEEPAAVVEEVVLPPQEEQIVTIEQGVFEEELAAEESGEEGQTPESGDIQEAENSSEQVEPETETALSEPEKTVEIVYEIIGGEVKEQGTQIKMTAVLSGFDEVEPSYQWQYNDGSEWKDIEGATSSTYTLDVTEDNYNYDWRVSVMG